MNNVIPTLEELLGNDSARLPGGLESININSVEEILPSCAFHTGRKELSEKYLYPVEAGGRPRFF